MCHVFDGRWGLLSAEAHGPLQSHANLHDVATNTIPSLGVAFVRQLAVFFIGNVGRAGFLPPDDGVCGLPGDWWICREDWLQTKVHLMDSACISRRKHLCAWRGHTVVAERWNWLNAIINGETASCLLVMSHGGNISVHSFCPCCHLRARCCVCPDSSGATSINRSPVKLVGWVRWLRNERYR
jgi:hypothetical protein